MLVAQRVGGPPLRSRRRQKWPPPQDLPRSLDSCSENFSFHLPCDMGFHNSAKNEKVAYLRRGGKKRVSVATKSKTMGSDGANTPIDRAPLTAQLPLHSPHRAHSALLARVTSSLRNLTRRKSKRFERESRTSRSPGCRTAAADRISRWPTHFSSARRNFRRLSRDALAVP